MKYKNTSFLLKLTFLFISFSSFGQTKNQNNYFRYLDSADIKVEEFPKVADVFLDSIPEPFEKNIKGRIAEYYRLKSLVSSLLDNSSEIYHYNILALKYAEKENNYELAGSASLELFYNLFTMKKDSTAFKYLDKAEKYFTLAEDKLGLAEVVQMDAFVSFYTENYEESIHLILDKLNYYKSIEEDSYYYMYALFMLTSNYIHLNDTANIYKSYKKFKILEKDTTISPFLYKQHDVTLNICLTEMHFEQKKIDSTLIYLKKSDVLKNYMNNSDKENQIKNYISYYKLLNDIDNENKYIDSLKYLNETLIDNNIDANFKINNSLIKNYEALEIETKNKFLNRKWILFLSIILMILIGFVIFRYKKIKNLIEDFSSQKKEFSFLKKNHEKLKMKAKGLENYITELKKDVKVISSITNIKEQINEIKELHKKIHLSSSVLLVKGEDHLDLISELNIDFFNEISTKHPELNSSEIILCYYLFMGFKNKEIGVFINNTIRSVESKRYRITNKLNLQVKDMKLVSYLQEQFTKK